MKPNIIHNKLHPTDYDRVAFVEEHFEELKEMYTTIMEHLKIPMGSESSGGSGITTIKNTFTTRFYVRINMSRFLQIYDTSTSDYRNATDDEKEIIRQNFKLYSKARYASYAYSYASTFGKWDGNYLCFPVAILSDLSYIYLVYRNIGNPTIFRTPKLYLTYSAPSTLTFTTGNWDNLELTIESSDVYISSNPEMEFTEYYTTDIGKIGLVEDPSDED